MGNVSVIDNPQNLKTQGKSEYFKQFIDTHMKFGQAVVFSDTKDQLFIGKEIDLPQNYGRQMLKQQLARSQTLTQTLQCILPIEYFQFRTVSTVCSQQQKCLLLSKKPDTTLKQMYNERKSKGQSFRVSQINSIINRIARALKIQQQSQSHLQLDMESIVFVNGKSYLLDSLLQDGQGMGQSIFGKYRAPETYNGTFDQQESGSQLLCQLFSLGVIALCLAFVKVNVQTLLYSRTQAYKKRRELSQSQIQNLLKEIKNQNLRNKLSILLSFTPSVRSKIYTLIEQNQKNEGKGKINDLSLDKSKKLYFDENSQNKNKMITVSHQVVRQANLNNQSVAFVPKREVLRQTLNNSTFNQKCTVPNSKLITQPISIMVKPPQKQNNSYCFQIIATDKQNQSLNTLNKTQLKPEIKSIKQKELLLTVTPQKQRKKQQFSTIKQVTEYDDGFSASQNKSIASIQGRFQGNIINGKKEGYGVFFFQEGSRYQGQWKNDKMHGFGKLFYCGNKLAYEGHWFEGQFHGNGKVYNNQPFILRQSFDYTDFNTINQEWVSFEGQLQHDKRQGWGILKLSNGERFEGEFKEDMLEGYGTFYSLTKGEIRGIWRDSKLVRRELF